MARRAQVTTYGAVTRTTVRSMARFTTKEGVHAQRESRKGNWDLALDLLDIHVKQRRAVRNGRLPA